MKRRVALRKSGVRFRMEEMTGLDLERQAVLTDRGRVEYDALILGLGSVPRFFGVPGAEEHAFRLRTMADALPLRLHILRRFEAAALQPKAARESSLTFVIVGGGPTGVEFAGALAELVHGPLHPDYPGIGQREPTVVLLEGGPRVLPGMPERLSAYALRRLRRIGVDVRLDSQVRSIAPDGVTMADGSRVASETVVWTAGVGGDPLVAAWGLPTGPGGRVPVSGTLQVEGHPSVFVVGDLAYLEHQGEALPQIAPVAIQQGRAAARNAARWLRSEELPSFKYKDPGMLAVIGRNAAVADIGAGHFTGITAWGLWLVIHIANLIGFRSRALVLVNWAWNYLTFRRSVRPILPESGRSRARLPDSPLPDSPLSDPPEPVRAPSDRPRRDTGGL